MTCFSSTDVLRFLGKKPNLDGQVPAHWTAQVTTDLRRRREGVRIKHFLGANSIKLYDKAYTERSAVLRPEFTMNDPSPFMAYRPKEGGDPQDLQWRCLRRGVADLYQRAQVCQKALNRYCDALASVDDSSTLEELTHHLERRVQWQGHPVRALHPFAAEDRELLQTINRGEFTLHGFRNSDLRALLYATPATSQKEERKRSAAVSRKLRLLRAHGLIQKLPHTYRYQVTEKGRQIINAVLAARHATVNHLLAQAA
jgi:DNA-binding MarR family transcriptional regulator